MRLTGHLPYKYHQLVYCLHTSALYSLATETSYFGYPWCCTNVSCQCLYPICEIFDTSVAVNSSNMSRPSDKRTNVGYNFNYMCTPNIADDNNKQANFAKVSDLQSNQDSQLREVDHQGWTCLAEVQLPDLPIWFEHQVRDTLSHTLFCHLRF